MVDNDNHSHGVSLDNYEIAVYDEQGKDHSDRFSDFDKMHFIRESRLSDDYEYIENRREEDEFDFSDEYRVVVRRK
jgi:hypothetical protein